MKDTSSTQLRYVVTFLSILAGAGYATFDAYWNSRHLPTRTPNVSTPSSAENQLIFDACVTFYGTVYLCGRGLYTFLGHHAHCAQLRRWSVWHMRLLNVVGGFALLRSGWRSFLTFGVIRPSAVLAVAMLVQAALNARCTGKASGRGSLDDT